MPRGSGILADKRGRVAEAESWWRKAADAGLGDAAANLGVLLAKQARMAEAWHRRAVDAGHPNAADNLAILRAQRDHAAAAGPWWRRLRRGRPSAR